VFLSTRLSAIELYILCTLCTPGPPIGQIDRSDVRHKLMEARQSIRSTTNLFPSPPRAAFQTGPYGQASPRSRAAKQIQIGCLGDHAFGSCTFRCSWIGHPRSALHSLINDGNPNLKTCSRF